jgi:hypothetical protein
MAATEREQSFSVAITAATIVSFLHPRKQQMNLLDPISFARKKTNSRLYVLGSGSSVNDLTPEQRSQIHSCDSIAFNWFCNYPAISPTFYLIREQANIPSRTRIDETPEIFLHNLQSRRYHDTTLIISDVSNHSPHAVNYTTLCKQLPNDGIITPDTYDGYFSDDLFKGCYHGALTLCNVLHVAHYLRYFHITFVGVDLNDSRYFWTENRGNISQKGLRPEDAHPVRKATLNLIQEFQAFSHQYLDCLNPHSALVTEGLMPAVSR